jgi:hypothetical protein
MPGQPGDTERTSEKVCRISTPSWSMARSMPSSSRDLLAAAGEGLTMMVNSVYNGWRFEDVWLDR